MGDAVRIGQLSPGGRSDPNPASSRQVRLPAGAHDPGPGQNVFRSHLELARRGQAASPRRADGVWLLRRRLLFDRIGAFSRCITWPIRTVEPGERGRFNQAIPISAIARRLEATGDESLLAQLRKPPPDPKRRARLAAAPPPADDRELIRLVDAAKCLLDRSDAVRDLLGSRAVDRAMVHVVVCRDVDEYTTLIRRLRQLALPVKGAAGAGVARLAGEGPGWGGARIDWPTADRDPEWAYKALSIELQRVLDDEGRRGKPTLIVAEVSRQEWSAGARPRAVAAVRATVRAAGA